MSGNAYWKNRQARLMYGRMDDAEVAARSVARIYAKASEEITQQMRDIFRVYKDKWNLTEKEAKRLLSVMDDGFFNPESLRRGINTIVDVDLRNQMLRDLETPAYQARLRRLQELQEQIDQMMVDVYKKDKQRQTEHYINTGTDTYYRGIYDVQRQVGFQFSFAHIDRKAFDRLLKSKWSGKNYSTRIWENTQHVADTVKEELMLEILTGKALDDCAEAIQHRFHVGAFQSRRIIRTESNFVSGQMQLKSYEECGAEYYEYVATLDSKTDEECGVLDGKRFKRSEAQPGVNFHPMHPFCRCSDVIALDLDVKAGLERRARDPKTGRLTKVPAPTSYMQWAKDNNLPVRGRKRGEAPNNNEHKWNAKGTNTRGQQWDSVLDEYIKNARPGDGDITIKGDRKVKNKEFENAELIRDVLGGDIVLLEDSDTSQKNPDYLWRGKFWEQQGMEKDSKNSIDQNIREGIQQIREKDNPGGIVLEASVSSLGKDEIGKIIFQRIRRSSPVDCDVILIRNDIIEDVFRYKK